MNKQEKSIMEKSLSAIKLLEMRRKEKRIDKLAKFIKRKDNKPECIEPDCKNKTKARGFCDVHYNRYISRVRKGSDTWEEIDKRYNRT